MKIWDAVVAIEVCKRMPQNHKVKVLVETAEPEVSVQESNRETSMDFHAFFLFNIHKSLLGELFFPFKMPFGSLPSYFKFTLWMEVQSRDFLIFQSYTAKEVIFNIGLNA